MRAAFRLLKRIVAALLISTIVITVIGVIVWQRFFILEKFLPEQVGHSQQEPTFNMVEEEETCDEKEILKTAKACTLLVGDVEKHGTGFVHSSGNYLITNYHVIDHYKYGFASVFYEGRFHSSRIAGLSLENDIAVINLEDELPGCSWADSKELELAENVFALGWPNSPYGESTITKGIFSRYVYPDEAEIPMIQTDTPINPGNSGGPLINRCGVVGINTSKVNWIDESAPSEGIGYAISSDYAENIVDELIHKDDGMVKIPFEQLSQDGRQDQDPGTDYNRNYLNPNSFVAYNYDQVIFWEDRKIHDQAVLKSWSKATDSDFVEQDRLDKLIDKLERSLKIAETLWDGYTNSKVTYAQTLELKQEYLFLSNEVLALTNKLNVEGSINAYKNCVEAWVSLEEEYDQQFTKQKKECEKILEVDYE